jgi:hypothetical protein
LSAAAALWSAGHTRVQAALRELNDALERRVDERQVEGLGGEALQTAALGAGLCSADSLRRAPCAFLP